MKCWCGYLSGAQIICIWSSSCHCHPKTPSSLASFKSRLFLPFWYCLTQVILGKRSINWCSYSISHIYRLVSKEKTFENPSAFGRVMSKTDTYFDSRVTTGVNLYKITAANKKLVQVNPALKITNTTTSILQPSYRTTCISQPRPR